MKYHLSHSKYISDGADGDANNDWDENVGKGILEFKKTVYRYESFSYWWGWI